MANIYMQNHDNTNTIWKVYLTQFFHKQKENTIIKNKNGTSSLVLKFINKKKTNEEEPSFKCKM